MAHREKKEDDDNASIFSGSNGTMLVGLAYAEPTANPAIFFAFHSFKPIKTLLPPTNGIIPELVGALGASSPSARYIFYAVSYETDLDSYNDTYSSFVSCQHFTSPSKGVLQFGIQATTKAAVQAGEERGGSWPGMKLVSTNWWHTVTVWFDGNDDKAASAAANGMTANMTNLATDAGKYVEFEFQNDADVSQSPLKSYGEKNLQRFAVVVAHYDPQQVFQKLQNSGFKISTA